MLEYGIHTVCLYPTSSIFLVGTEYSQSDEAMMGPNGSTFATPDPCIQVQIDGKVAIRFS